MSSELTEVRAEMLVMNKELSSFRAAARLAKEKKDKAAEEKANKSKIKLSGDPNVPISDQVCAGLGALGLRLNCTKRFASSPVGSLLTHRAPPGCPVQLAEALRSNATRVMDLFRSWDADGDGEVSRKEFHKAMPALGLEVPKSDVEILFNTWDTDGGGSLAYKELKRILTGQHLPKKKNLVLSGEGPMSDQLADALKSQATRVMDLFRSWDQDGDGEVSRKEFHRAVPALGLEVPKADIDALFNAWDKDGGGNLSYKELKKILSGPPSVKAKPSTGGTAKAVGAAMALAKGFAPAAAPARPPPVATSAPSPGSP